MNLNQKLPFFSYIFHPIFIGFYAGCYYFFIHQSFQNPSNIFHTLAYISIITIAMPIAFFFTLKTLGKISSVMVEDIKQRKIPLFLQAILTVLLIQKEGLINHFTELYIFFLAGLYSTLLAFLLLFKNIKASLHMVGMSALAIFIFTLDIKNPTSHLLWTLFIITMNALVALSRLIMKAHSPKEIIIGLIVGAIPQLVCVHY